MSLYLKYRPQDFDNLEGQDFVKSTLRKAIAQNKTVWAYLLCWPRWTWKTTTARLLAKSINCLNQKDWNPCLECDVCKWFNDESLVDIIEIDAASNTWVDNIRDIIERANFSPTFTKYKVYIIDEVHMLSKWAFNALLKILEEPPKHVKFILATTETHKVPDTILSRCQRYDFKRISDNDIKNRLWFISTSEWISIDEDSLNYIVKNSWGWLRNAISLFEQLIDDNNITFENVKTKLGISDSWDIEKVFESLIVKDNNVVKYIEEIINKWINFKIFTKDLLFYAKAYICNNIDSENSHLVLNIMDELNTAYINSKDSIDENTTLLIWYLKIVTSYRNFAQKNTESIDPSLNKINITDNSKDIKVSSSQQNKDDEIINKEIDHSDVMDIFWDTNINEITIDKESSPVNNFDSSIFINKLKENWAKWALTMALRPSVLSIDNNNLNIKTSTSIAKKNIENSDSISLMNKVLWDLWYSNISIKII